MIIIEKLIFLILYLMTEFTNYLLAYHFIFGIPIRKKRISWMAAIGIVLSVHLILSYFLPINLANDFSILTMLVIPGFLLLDTRIKRYGLYFFIVLGMSSVTVSASLLLSILLPMTEQEIINHYVSILICQLFPATLLFVLYIFKILRKDSFPQVELGKKQYILFYVGAGCVFFIQASLQELCRYEFPGSILTVCCLVTSVACVLFLILILWHAIDVSKENMLKEYIHEAEIYGKLREEHFNQLILQDEKIRRFRHDMNAHMIALREYCEDRDQEKIQKYLDNIVQEPFLQSVKNYTGDRGVDAVLNDLQEKAISVGIEISYQGSLAGIGNLQSFELCSLFYNLIQNAIEACEKIPAQNAKNIWVELMTYEERNIITIINSTNDLVIVSDQTLKTTKEDNRNHGFGSKNVQEIIDRHKGTLKYSCRDGLFSVEIVV